MTPSSFTLHDEKSIMSARITAQLAPASILGYPRIGRRRELKKAVEAYWKGNINEDELRLIAAQLRADTRARLIDLGLSSQNGAVPESFSFYDQVLDATFALGAIPQRFAAVEGSDIERYFVLARGDDAHQPLEMTKWFDTNYHYSVPEISPETPLQANAAALVSYVEEARTQGIDSRPVLVGPVTYLLLAKAADEAPQGFAPISRLDEFVHAYASLLHSLHEAGAQWVQLDEPALVSDSLGYEREEILEFVTRAYSVLGEEENRPAIVLTAPYGDSAYAQTRLAALPVEAVHADLVRGTLDREAIADGSFAQAYETTTFVAGIIDGRNIWQTDLTAAVELLEELRNVGVTVSVATANNLQHVPHDVADEPALDPRLARWLAFADQKVEHVALLAHGLSQGRTAIADALEANAAVLADRAQAPGVRVDSVRQRVAAVTAKDRSRAGEAERRAAQLSLNIPQLATTTIGYPPGPGPRHAACG